MTATAPLDDTSCPSWHVIWTEPRAEDEAVRELGHLGFDVYCPAEKCRRWRRNRRQYFQRPLFPRYAFVAFDSRQPGWGAIYDARGVMNILSNNGQPMGLPTGFVENKAKYQILRAGVNAMLVNVRQVPDYCLTERICGLNHNIGRHRKPLAIDGHPILALSDIVLCAVAVGFSAAHPPLRRAHVPKPLPHLRLDAAKLLPIHRRCDSCKTEHHDKNNKNAHELPLCPEQITALIYLVI